MAVPPAPSDSEPSTLTFPPQHYAKLSPSTFLHRTLSSKPTPTRPNGRHPTQSRAPSINTGSLTNAHGSAVIRLGSTSVVCGVRAELLPVTQIHNGLPAELQNWTYGNRRSSPNNVVGRAPRSDADVIAELNLLVPNLELSTGCNPAHLPGNAPGTEAQSLSQRMLSLLRISDLVPLWQLLVWGEAAVDEGEGDDVAVADNPNDPGRIAEVGGNETSGRGRKREIKGIWTLYIDILYISLDGSAFSAGWLALLAALRDTALPEARWDEDREIIVCSPDKSRASILSLRSMPVPLSASVFTHAADGERATWVLHDADDFEEAIAKGEVTVVVAYDRPGNARKGHKHDVLLRMEMGGSTPNSSDISQLIQSASARLDEWSDALQWDNLAQ